MLRQPEDPLRSPIVLAIAGLYLLGGVVGLVALLPRLNGASMSLPEALVKLFHLALLIAAILGSVQLLRRQGSGVRLLFWLSWLCVPSLVTPWFLYWCGFAIDVVPELSLFAGSFNPSIQVHFGHRFTLLHLPDLPGVGAGVNLVALGCALVLGRLEPVPPIRRRL